MIEAPLQIGGYRLDQRVPAGPVHRVGTPARRSRRARRCTAAQIATEFGVTRPTSYRHLGSNNRIGAGARYIC